LVPQTAQNSAKVGIEFCYTLVPDLIDIGLVGTPPVFSDECVTGPLGFSVNVYVNGRQVGGDDDPHQDALPNFNPASGIFTARVTPDFGVNVFQIEAKRAGADTPFAVDAGSFIFGTPLALITDGQRATEGLFTPRGINLDIDKALVEGDIKDMILKFVNRPQTSDLILSTFKKEAATAVSSCTEVDPPTRSGGSVSVEFIPETFSLGSVELLSFTTANDGMLHLSARINGMHGEADMIDLNAPTVTYGGKQINFVPLTISIARMDVTLGVAFRKTHEGNLQLDLKRISEQEVVEAIGDGPLGSMVSVNADRNPYAAGFEFLDQQQGLVRKLFNDTLETTFLCGIENGLNNNLTGIFGKGANDIELINSNPNAFRLPLAFDFLGKHFPIDVALNVPRGEIEFDSEGIHVRDVPVRINPNLNELNSLASLHTEGVLASVSRFMTSDEPGPQRNITTDIHKVGLLLGEDAINQALFTANLMGLLDLDVDADFYAQTGFTPTSRLLPLGSMFLTNQVDVNMDGNDQNDAQVPVLLKIRTDKSRPPMLSFLSEAETTRLVAKEQALIDDAGNQDPSGGTDTREPRFKSGSRYFRLAASGLEIAVFEQEPKPEAGATTFCNVPVPTTDNANLTAKGFCPVAADARTLKPMEQVTAEGGQCAPDQTFDLPKANGDIISRSVLNPDFAGDPVPLYRVKLGLVLHGEFKGVNREVPAVDRVKLSADELKAKNIFRIKLIPGDTGLREAHVTSVEVLENHTGQPDLQIVNLFEDFFSAAVGTDCSMFNEVKVPLPDQFAFDTEKEGLIKDLGLESLDLGLLPEQFPQVFIDDNRLFLDVLLFADLKFVEGGTSPGGNI
jgi:hypothetical protein